VERQESKGRSPLARVWAGVRPSGGGQGRPKMRRAKRRAGSGRRHCRGPRGQTPAGLLSAALRIVVRVSAPWGKAEIVKAES